MNTSSDNSQQATVIRLKRAHRLHLIGVYFGLSGLVGTLVAATLVLIVSGDRPLTVDPSSSASVFMGFLQENREPLGVAVSVCGYVSLFLLSLGAIKAMEVLRTPLPAPMRGARILGWGVFGVTLLAFVMMNMTPPLSALGDSVAMSAFLDSIGSGVAVWNQSEFQRLAGALLAMTVGHVVLSFVANYRTAQMLRASTS